MKEKPQKTPEGFQQNLKKTFGLFWIPPLQRKKKIPERKWKISNLGRELQWCRQPFMVWEGREGIDINKLIDFALLFIANQSYISYYYQNNMYKYS